MKHSVLTAVVSAIMALMLFAWGIFPCPQRGPNDKVVVALVLDTGIGMNSAVIREGAERAASTFGAELMYAVPSEIEGTERQLALVAQHMDAGAEAVLLKPVSREAAEGAVKLCAARDIRLVILDAFEEFRVNAPYVGTNHRASGDMAAEALIEHSGAGRLTIFYPEGQIYSERLLGAISAAERRGVEFEAHVIDENDPLGRHERERVLISKMTERDALLCLDGALTNCAAEILRQMGASGPIALAGFDCDQAYVDCLVDGTACFTILRAPLAVGYRGVECAMKLVAGRIVEPVQYIDATMVKSEDALDAKYAHLIFPFIY